MEKLIYSQFVLFIILLVVSCTKDATVTPEPSVSPQDAPASIDLSNDSGTAYEADFIGTTKYAVDMPAHSKQEIKVKGDTYNIEVHSLGINALPDSIAWNGQPAVVALRAHFNGIAIADNSLEALFIH